MALSDPYATAKASLRDNVKVLLTAIAGVAGLLLAGTPFSGLGTLPLDWRLIVAVLSILVASALLGSVFWILLRTLQPDVVTYESLREGFNPDSIADRRTRAEIKDLIAVFRSERSILLPDKLPSQNVEGLERAISIQFAARSTDPAAAKRYEEYHDALQGINYWAAFMRLQRRVQRALLQSIGLSVPALAAVLLFAWAANPPRLDSTDQPSVVVNESTKPDLMQAAPRPFGPILFKTDSANLDDAARKTIMEARGQLRTWPESVALVRAYTDTRGTDRRNTELAQLRAKAVSNELIRIGGIAENRVYVASLGPTDLPVMTAHDIDHAENRSVEIVVVRLKGN